MNKEEQSEIFIGFSGLALLLIGVFSDQIGITMVGTFALGFMFGRLGV